MDTIFVKNVKDDGPAHRAGLRTGELSFSGSLPPALWLGWDSQIQVLGKALSWRCHPCLVQGFSGGAMVTRWPAHVWFCPPPFPQETGW